MPMVDRDALYPKLSNLLDLWVQRCGDRSLPARRDFAIEDLRPWLGHLALIEVGGAPARFRVRLAGTILTAYEGQDDTGRYLDEVIPAAELAGRLAPYRECVQSRQPVLDVPLFPAELHALRVYQRLLLPCAADGGAVDIIILAVYGDSGRE